MKAFFILWILWGLSDAAEMPEAEIRIEKEELEKWSQLIGRISSLSSQEAIKQLAEGVQKTSNPRSYSIEGAEEVHVELQQALLSIPGHAQYFGTRIRESYAQAEWLEKGEKLGQPKPVNTIADLNVIGREGRWSFQTLAQMPSREAVQVLGEFLNDERGTKEYTEPNENPLLALEEIEGHPMLSMEAAAALSKLPLKSKPADRVIRDHYTSLEDLKKWRNWYQQIKEGRRTFSFEGDPQEYSLQGPVREARNPDVPRATKRPGVSGDAEAISGKAAARSAIVWIIGIVGAVMALGGYFYARRTKPA